MSWCLVNVLVVVLAISFTQASCPVGYDEVTQHCLQYVQKSLNFNEAKSSCESTGGRLAEINSLAEQMMVVKYLMGKGATDAWIGNSQDNAMGSFSNWMANHPSPKSSKDDSCIVLNADNAWQWQDTSCSNNNAVVCQF